MRAADIAAPYPVVSVGRLAKYVGRRLTDDPKLRWLGVRGEISGLAVQPNGNVYFDLKDREALIKCVAWSAAAATLPPLANGQEIVAVGAVGTYPKKSTYQLVVATVEHGGVGQLHAKYEELKRRLDAEGLFAEVRKRSLPRYPFRVALVSSATANGAGDFLSQAALLAPHVIIDLFETPVQGANAAGDIVRALERASRADVDLVVLARGGGSYEDLFVFSDERVVRALARCAHPTVSAIGHEADAPLTDFVADRRCPTPSTAAQTVLPRRTDLLRGLATSSGALDRTIGRTMARARRELERIEIRSPLADANRLLAPRRQELDTLAIDLRRAVDGGARIRADRFAAFARRLEARNPSVALGARRERLTVAAYGLRIGVRAAVAREGRRFERLADALKPAASAAIDARRRRLQLERAHLDGRDPTKILERGYAIVTAGGRSLTDATAVPLGTVVTAQLARGTLQARVEAVAVDGGE